MACLPVLTAADLLELGVVEAGERQRMLAAAAALRTRPALAAATPRPRDQGGCAPPAGASGSAAAPAGSRGLSGAGAGRRSGGLGRVRVCCRALCKGFSPQRGRRTLLSYGLVLLTKQLKNSVQLCCHHGKSTSVVCRRPGGLEWRRQRRRRPAWCPRRLRRRPRS